MESYLSLLKKIYFDGSDREDRTGTGTRSIFGAQLRFNLQDGFPLVTTKKVFFRGLAEELFWMLSGNTNIRYLQNRNVHIWDGWADKNGDLGPVYGAGWRYIPYHEDHRKCKLDIMYRARDLYADYKDDTGMEPNWASDFYQKRTQKDKLVYSLWVKMINKCYSAKGSEYSVSPYWKSYKNFEESISTIPMYWYWRSRPDRYILSPRYKGSEVYSPSTCVFIPRSLDGKIIMSDIYEYMGKRYLSKRDLIDDNKNIDWSQVERYKSEQKDWIIRPKYYIDQLSNVINQIKYTPDSRRILINSWVPNLLEEMRLPPCHLLMQFYVGKNDTLSCQVYQRSADMFLGVPFNLASYSLLTMLLAESLNLNYGELVWTGGDCHIYNNHLNQIEEQLSREPYPLPELIIKNVKPVDQYTMDDIELRNYQYHPSIHGDVSI